MSADDLLGEGRVGLFDYLSMQTPAKLVQIGKVAFANVNEDDTYKKTVLFLFAQLIDPSLSFREKLPALIATGSLPPPSYPSPSQADKSFAKDLALWPFVGMVFGVSKENPLTSQEEELIQGGDLPFMLRSLLLTKKVGFDAALTLPAVMQALRNPLTSPLEKLEVLSLWAFVTEHSIELADAGIDLLLRTFLGEKDDFVIDAYAEEDAFKRRVNAATVLGYIMLISEKNELQAKIISAFYDVLGAMYPVDLESHPPRRYNRMQARSCVFLMMSGLLTGEKEEVNKFLTRYRHVPGYGQDAIPLAASVTRALLAEESMAPSKGEDGVNPLLLSRDGALQNTFESQGEEQGEGQLKPDFNSEKLLTGILEAESNSDSNLSRSRTDEFLAHFTGDSLGYLASRVNQFIHEINERQAKHNPKYPACASKYRRGCKALAILASIMPARLKADILSKLQDFKQNTMHSLSDFSPLNKAINSFYGESPAAVPSFVEPEFNLGQVLNHLTHKNSPIRCQAGAMLRKYFYGLDDDGQAGLVKNLLSEASQVGAKKNKGNHAKNCRALAVIAPDLPEMLRVRALELLISLYDGMNHHNDASFLLNAIFSIRVIGLVPGASLDDDSVVATLLSRLEITTGKKHFLPTFSTLLLVAEYLTPAQAKLAIKPGREEGSTDSLVVATLIETVSKLTLAPSQVSVAGVSVLSSQQGSAGGGAEKPAPAPAPAPVL